MAEASARWPHGLGIGLVAQRRMMIKERYMKTGQTLNDRIATIWVLFVLWVLFPAVAYGAAAPQSSASFEQEWSKLVAAAKQEGTLGIASGGAPSRQYRPVVDAFSKKFGVK